LWMGVAAFDLNFKETPSPREVSQFFSSKHKEQF
jgi:hypothetical protein